MGAHGDEVTTFVLDPSNNLVGGLAVGEFGVGRNVGGLKLGLDLAKVGGVVDDFLTDSVRAIGSGGPSIGDMEQDQAAVSELGELLYVFDDGAVGCGAIERNQDFVVHKSDAAIHEREKIHEADFTRVVV